MTDPDYALLKDLAETLSHLETWEEKCRQDAKRAGVTDPEALSDYLEEREGDQDDDWLLERNRVLEEMISASRAIIGPAPGETLWAAGPTGSVSDMRFTHGPTPDLAQMMPLLPDNHLVVRLRPDREPDVVGIAVDGEISDVPVPQEEDPSP